MSKPTVKIKPLEDWIKRGYVENPKSLFNYLSIDSSKNVTKTSRGHKYVNLNSVGSLTKMQVKDFLGKEVEIDSCHTTEEGILFLKVSTRHGITGEKDYYKCKIPAEMTNFKYEKYLDSKIVLKNLSRDFEQVGDKFKVGCTTVSKEGLLEDIDTVLSIFKQKRVSNRK